MVMPPSGTRSEREAEVLTMYCTCAVSHAGRPADQDGCGAFWNYSAEL